MVDGCRTYALVGGKEMYSSFEDIAADVQRLGKQQNNCLDEIISLKGEIKLLKAVIAWLEGDTLPIRLGILGRLFGDQFVLKLLST